MIGPHGEKRPADVMANARHVARLATVVHDDDPASVGGDEPPYLIGIDAQRGRIDVREDRRRALVEQTVGGGGKGQGCGDDLVAGAEAGREGGGVKGSGA